MSKKLKYWINIHYSQYCPHFHILVLYQYLGKVSLRYVENQEHIEGLLMDRVHTS
jgi:hypothetical protein